MSVGETVGLHHRIEGPEDAPVLVLSNSLGTTLDMWRDRTPALRERFRLVRYDHRGHGGSPVPPGPYTIEDLGRDALSLLDELGAERFSFCGLSVGGMVGMWLASEVPERVKCLVLCCTAKSFDAETYLSRARTVREHGGSEVADAVLERWFTREFRENHPEVVAWAGRMLRETPAEGYAGLCEAIAGADLSGRIGAIDAPTLIIAGAGDSAAPPERSEEIRASVPDARLEILSPAAHLANVENPEAMTPVILDHLKVTVGEGT